MSCVKCGGLSILTQFSDFFTSFYAYKCVNCSCLVERTQVQIHKLNSRVGMQFPKRVTTEGRES